MFRAALLAACALGHPALAQVTADATAGTVVGRPGGNFSITGGTLAGSNLFHSFSQFSVPTGRAATFSGVTTVANIIGRVTGNAASNIDGTLRSTIAGANLYLINPNGVAFGPNARLDISGSVYVASADYLRLGASGRFDAGSAAGSTFSSAPPSAFGFLGGPPAPIAVNGSLLGVPSGARLALVGGDVRVSNATVNAPAGRVDLASLASGGEVRLEPAGLLPSPDHRLGTVSLANSVVALNGAAGSGGMSVHAGGLTINASQIRSPNTAATPGGNFSASIAGDLNVTASIVQFETSGSGAAGNVTIRGGRIVVEENSLVSTATVGQGNGGTLSISASDALTLSGSATRVGSGTLGSFSGNSGNIVLTAPAITVDGAAITASTSGAGKAGEVDVAGGRIVISNHGIIESSTRGSGAAGSLRVRASESLDISGMDVPGSRGGIYSTTIGFFASGDAGSILVEAPLVRMSQLGEIQSTSELGGGNAGRIDVRVGRLEMTGGARISTTTFNSVGNAGSVDVQATESILISGRAANGESTALRSNSQGAGNAGSVTVQTRDLRVDEGAIISSSTYAGGQAGNVSVLAANIEVASDGLISSDTYGFGNAGTVTVRASDTIRLSDGGITSNALGTTGNAGSILVSAPSLIMFSNGAIQSVTESAGNGGSITVEAARVSLTGGSQIGATTFSSGKGGAISISASESAFISGDVPIFSSGLYTNSQGAAATGEAGPITVVTPSLTIRNSGTIASNTEGPKSAGPITLQVGDLRLETGGSVSASTLSDGNSGTISVIASGNVFISGTNDAGDSSGLFTRTDGRGNGGKIEVNAANMYINGFSGLSSESDARGNAGEILVNVAGRLELTDDGQISTQSTLTTGGNITIRARDLVYLRSGAIVTEVAQGGGAGGNITIDPEFVVIDRGFIVANAIDGNGGNITIVANNFLNQHGTITATSRTGISGNIEIRSPVVDANGALVQLSGSFLDASRLIRESCATRAGRDASRFVAAPRGGLAAAPQNEGAPRGAPSTSSSSQVRSSCAG